MLSNLRFRQPPLARLVARTVTVKKGQQQCPESSWAGLVLSQSLGARTQPGGARTVISDATIKANGVPGEPPKEALPSLSFWAPVLLTPHEDFQL